MTIPWKPAVVAAVTSIATASAPLLAAEYDGGPHVVVARYGDSLVTLRYRHHKPIGHASEPDWVTDDVVLTIERRGRAPERFDGRALKLVDPTSFPDPGKPGCEVGAPLTIVRHYAVLEAVLIAKGCRGYARIVDLAGLPGVLTPFRIDHVGAPPSSTHSQFVPMRRVRVTSLSHFAIPVDRRFTSGPWELAVVQARDRAGAPVELAIDRPSASELPSVGEEITLGRLGSAAYGDAIALRLSPAHERAYASAQRPR